MIVSDSYTNMNVQREQISESHIDSRLGSAARLRLEENRVLCCVWAGHDNENGVPSGKLT